MNASPCPAPRTLIRGARVIDPASGFDRVADVALAQASVLAVGDIPRDFDPQCTLDASGCWLLPGLVDLAVRLGEPGGEHAGMLESELGAALAGGVTSLVCPPDTDPVLDESGLVKMLRFRAEKLDLAHVYPQGALTRGLHGQALTELAELTDAGCVAFGQADAPITDTQVLRRALQYARTFNHTVWLQPLDPWLGQGVAASGALATRMGLSGVPVMAETIALHTIFELVRATGCRVHLCRLSSAEGVELLRQARTQGLPVSGDVSVHSLHLSETDIGYYDSHARLNPVLRSQADRSALRAALADGTLSALVSDHNPVADEAKALPFAEATPGASAVELLASLVCKWQQDDDLPLAQAWARVSADPAQVLGAALGRRAGRCGRLQVGGIADLCVFDPLAHWRVQASALRSQGRHTPFAGYELPGRVRYTLVGGRVVHSAT